MVAGVAQPGLELKIQPHIWSAEIMDMHHHAQLYRAGSFAQNSLIIGYNQHQGSGYLSSNTQTPKKN
jgi:hypothetical protein